MSTIRINLNLENAAFDHECSNQECQVKFDMFAVGNFLIDLGKSLKLGKYQDTDTHNLHDENGNTCGTFKFSEDTKLELPSWQSYGHYSSDNYGMHTLKFYVGNVAIYFSYSTVVAFHSYTHGLVVRENVWGVTTGKHLNWIDGGNKSSRVDGDTFKKMLSEALSANE